MSHTDPIADMLTRVRNANRVGMVEVRIPYSTVKEAVAKAIVQSGFLSAVKTNGEKAKKELLITLKYTADKRPVLCDLQRVSLPSRRVYVKHNAIPQVRNGLGVAVLSTPKGVMTDAQARTQKVGGEVLCSVW